MFGRRREMKKQTERAWRQAAETRGKSTKTEVLYVPLGNWEMNSYTLRKGGVERKSDKRYREKRNEYTGEEN